MVYLWPQKKMKNYAIKTQEAKQGFTHKKTKMSCTEIIVKKM